MRPLFWTAISLPPGPPSEPGAKGSSVWDSLQEAELKVEQFQEVFSQKVAAKKSASPADGSGEQSSGGKASPKTKAAPTFSALDGKRAQGVGILMGSTKMDAWKMSRAVYELDPSVCSLEKMKAIYEQRYTPEELSMATAHLEAQVALPAEKRSRLAPGDQFLYGLSQISFFEARVDCMLFTSRFAENIFDVKDRIGVLGDACDALRDADALPEVLGIVLACGNYMNGGSRRGQADGFNIDILPKLRDVKSKDNTTTLLRYVASMFCAAETAKEEPPPPPPPPSADGEVATAPSRPTKARMDIDKDRFPEPELLKRASTIQFDDLNKDINVLLAELTRVSRLVDKVISGTDDEAILNPFKDTMEAFVTDSKLSLEAVAEVVKKVKSEFDDRVSFFRYKTKSGEPSPQDFFEIWAVFLPEFLSACASERRAIALAKFEEAQRAKQLLQAAEKNRKKITSGGMKSRLFKKLGLGGKAKKRRSSNDADSAGGPEGSGNTPAETESQPADAPTTTDSGKKDGEKDGNETLPGGCAQEPGEAESVAASGKEPNGSGGSKGTSAGQFGTMFVG